MRRPLRLSLAAIGLLLLLGSGASIFWQPAHEVLYQLDGPQGACSTLQGCVLLYTLTVGNTGSEPQAQVVVRLRADLAGRAVLHPSVKTFGKIERPVVVSEAGGVRTFALGPLPRDERVELSLVFAAPTRKAAPAWDDLLVAVEAAQGPVRAGHPAWVALFRMWYAILTAW